MDFNRFPDYNHMIVQNEIVCATCFGCIESSFDWWFLVLVRPMGSIYFS